MATIHRGGRNDAAASHLTYVSLFSSAGVGCYGFLQQGFKCVATNELIARRLDVQRANDKCQYETGYILGDITDPAVQERLFSEVNRWKQQDSITDIDVVIATPPCQGMSVANHKKKNDEIRRNSLIVESLSLIGKINPKIFIFENVPAFMRTVCTDLDGSERPIGDAIDRHLGAAYSIFARTLNFKNYGSYSSRLRTIVIGVRNDLADLVSPIELFPDFRPELTLRECIGDLPALTEPMQSLPDDIYHMFRPYPDHMRAWVTDLQEGQSAFDNDDPMRKPHRIVDGRYILNQQKNADKYRRQVWDKVAPCVHTRNDQFASQNTIHPSDDRVFSIRELMRMMAIPSEFRWVSEPSSHLAGLNAEARRLFMKRHEVNIRQSIGEAVPTGVFEEIAGKVKEFLSQNQISDTGIKEEILANGLGDPAKLLSYIRHNPKHLPFVVLARIAELAAHNRENREAYFTNKSLITQMLRTLPQISATDVEILEPAVGTGNFIPLITRLLDSRESVTVTAVDVDRQALEILDALIPQMNLPANAKVVPVCEDFLSPRFLGDFHLCIGNPPFSKSTAAPTLKQYRRDSVNKVATNTAAFFIEKAAKTSDNVLLIMPKFLLNTTEFAETRRFLARQEVSAIIDFGEKGFKGVLVETIAITLIPGGKPGKTKVISIPEKDSYIQQQSYIFDPAFPYWIIYRDELFDQVCRKLQFGVFTVFRDRQMTNAIMTQQAAGNLPVIRSRNISEDGSGIISISGYDAHIHPETAQKLSVYQFFDKDDVYLTPNMTYKPRVVRKPAGTLVNGSAAILTLVAGEPQLTDDEMRYFASDEYRDFYRTARNRQTRSLNVDASSVFFFGRYNPEAAA